MCTYQIIIHTNNLIALSIKCKCTFRRVPNRNDVRIRIRQRPAQFPPRLWNVHEATLNNEPRTNNQCEAWNNRFRFLVGFQRPDIWTLIEAIQKEGRSVRAVTAQDAIGNPHGSAAVEKPESCSINVARCVWIAAKIGATFVKPSEELHTIFVGYPSTEKTRKEIQNNSRCLKQC